MTRVALENKKKISEFKSYKKDAITAARELCYSREVREAVEKAKTVSQISAIMKWAREGTFEVNCG